MEEMHDELTKCGRIGPSTGVIWLGRRLGILTDSKPARGRGHMVRLGKEQGLYWLRESRDRIAELMDAFANVPDLMRVATDTKTPHDVTRACDAVMDAVAKGFGIKSKDANYTRKTVGRKVIAYCRAMAHSHSGRHSQAGCVATAMRRRRWGLVGDVRPTTMTTTTYRLLILHTTYYLLGSQPGDGRVLRVCDV